MKTAQLLALATLTAGLSAGQAAVTTYTQSSAFFADLSTLSFPWQTETYESYAQDTEILEGGTLGAYTYSGFPSYGPADPQGYLTGRIDDRDQPGANAGFYSVVGGVRSLGSFYTETSPVLLPKAADYFFDGDSFFLGLPANTYAIGMFFNVTGTPAANDAFFINTSVGSATSQTNVYDTTVGNNDGTNGGLGTLDLLFVGLISDTPFTSAQIGETAFGNVGWNMDNLTTATPEPTSIGLLSFGLAGLLGYSRRRAVR